jgi:hypothetical protein
MAYMVNRDAPYSGLANLMAMNGRFGDTELVHMSKPEIRGLASLGELTVNPDTGLPEAFSLKAALPIIGGIAGSMIMPGIGSALGSGAMGSLLSGTSGMMIGSALGSFGGGLLAGQPFGQAALGGLMAGATSGIFGGAFGGGGEAGQAAGSVAANTGSTANAGSTAVATGTSTSAVAPPMVDSTFGGMKIFGSPPAPVISQPSSLQSWLGANKNKLLLGGAGLAAAGLAGDEGGGEVAPSPPITPLTQYTFNRERREGAPRTEEELRRQATQGGNYSFFGPGAFDPIARANEGGLVSLANQQPAQQRSNVTNFMFSDNPQDQNVFDEMFKVGEAMSQPQQQPNTGLMQLAVGGQPKSNIAQMLNPTLRQQVPSLPPFNYDALRRRASIGQEKSPVDIFQTQHEEILRDALGRIVEDSSKEIIETPEEPVSPIAPIPKPVNVFSDDGDPDTAGMSGDDIAGPGVAAAMGMADTEADVGAAAEAAEAEADAEAAGADEAAGPDDALARGGLVGLANGGQAKSKENSVIDYLLPFVKEQEGTLKKRTKAVEATNKNMSYDIGHGHKITKADLSRKGLLGLDENYNIITIPIKNWNTTTLNSNQMEQIAKYDLRQKYRTLPNKINKLKKQNKNSFKNARLFNDLSVEEQGALLDINFNVKKGVSSFPKFVSGILNKDPSVIRAEYKRYWDNPETGKRQELGRNVPFFETFINPLIQKYRQDNNKDIIEKLESTPRSRMSDPFRPSPYLPEKELDIESSQQNSEGNGLLEMLQNLFTSQDDNTNTITIPEGATLSGLARDYDTTVKDIMELNKIENPDLIPAGGNLIIPRYQGGSINQYFEGQVIGKGDGQSDQILFEVEGKNPDMALLSRDEYVLPADAVSMLGNGSSNAGAKELDQFVKSLRQQSFGTQRQQQRVNPQRGLSALV